MNRQANAFTLPKQLTAELAALSPSLTTVEARREAIEARGGLRSKYNAKLVQSRRACDLSELACMNIGRELNRLCDSFVLELLPPADSGRYVGYPRTS